MTFELHTVAYIGLSKEEFREVQNKIGECGRENMMTCDVWKNFLPLNHQIVKELETREIDGDIDVVVYAE